MKDSILKGSIKERSQGEKTFKKERMKMTMRKLYQNVNSNAPRTPARGGDPRMRPKEQKVPLIKEPPCPNRNSTEMKRPWKGKKHN